MSTAKYDGVDKNGVAKARGPRFALALLPAAILLISGCDVVLGIDEPIRSARDGGPRDRDDAGTEHDGGDEAGAGASGSDAPPTVAPETECEDGVLRCDDSTSGNRSKCIDGQWADHDPCGPKEQCDSQADAECKPLPVEGEPCDEPGMHKCPGVAKPDRRVCDEDDLVWKDDTPCASGQACDRTDGECAPIVPACAGRMPGDFVCAGAIRHTCGQDLTISVEAPCESAAHCQQSTGATCALCTQGAFTCEGRMVLACNAAGNGWTVMDTCESEALCNPLSGTCTAAPCTEGQYRCSGNQLQVCNAELTGWDMLQQCMDGLCDQANGQCDRCSASHCDGNTSMICSADRQTLESDRCVAPTGVCTGRGQCVQCAGPDDCGTATVCGAPICRDHECAVNILGEPGAACGGGFVCDMTGGCVDWSLDQLMPDTTLAGEHVFIRAKPGRALHAPGMVGAPAAGTSVVLREDGATVEVPPADVLVAVPDAITGGEQINITIPPRAPGWALDEIVSIIVTYDPPGPAMPSIGALEFTYERPIIIVDPLPQR